MFGSSEQSSRKRCAVYTRVSSDPDKKGESTDRQLDNCRAFCDAREWLITATYEDVDESAYTSKDKRPGLRALLEDLSNGTFDTILVWRLDRLARRNDEFEQIWSLCQRHNIALASVTEPVDTTSGVGVAVMRMLVTFAGLESTIKSERLAAKNLQDARKGLPQPGGIRSFGYDQNMNIIHDQAKVIRQAAQRVIIGEASISIARDLAARGITGKRGSLISEAALRSILTNHTICGERSYHGTYMAPGTWEPIISPETGTTIRYLLAGSKGGRNRNPEIALLSGLLRCANCGNSLLRNRTINRYQCQSECSQTNSIHATNTEQWVTELVLWRLELRWPTNGRTPTLESDNSTQIIETYDWAASALTRLNVARYIDGAMSHLEYVNARTALETRIGQKLHHISTYVPPPVLPGDFDPRNARHQFPSLTGAQQQAVLELEINHIVLTKGSRSMWDHGRLAPNYWQALPKHKAHLPIPDFNIAPRKTPYSNEPRLQNREQLLRLYRHERIPVTEIAKQIGCETVTVFYHLHRHGIRLHTQDTDSYRRIAIPENELRELYVNQQLNLAQLSEHFGTSKVRLTRNLENYKIPVRTTTRRSKPEIVMLDELYNDPIVIAALNKFRIKPQPQAGTLAERFGTPRKPDTQLLATLYHDVGLSSRQIELVTGIPQRVVLRSLHANPDTTIRKQTALGSPASQRYRRPPTPETRPQPPTKDNATKPKQL